MKQAEKNRVIELISKIFDSYISEIENKKINEELDLLISDPKWSGYIFWTNDYCTKENGLDYEKFFQKIEEYELSDEYKRNKYIISLVNDLLNKNFNNKLEMDIVNELRKLIPNEDWIDCLFVSKSCFLENGQLDEKEFLKSMGLIEFDESNLVFHFEHN
ncbi:hypothetical protein [Moraxella catarrhalis]|mgnify:FL=1|uniref:hypothetical protein n=1 Tax=Moraxella catarrhalis TaxID=480 RepID=UPI000202ABF3|nr:hypothetical protein [Moraxella catarrhalis]EGE17123.1 hypothetical protein E9K_00040 [Moraxella catarrhalis 103P14B1]EGE22117.1 hypothetical protein E9W_09732 [Moraxella catarrhalis CO72]MPX07571.1 hypothetical protein [Moraxella catarrhalis]MPX17997.1 hypothetical protein [Moraxella catarrhalis]MPX67912.1 hypothetical protein [Moraxella catarrhalis]